MGIEEFLVHAGAKCDWSVCLKTCFDILDANWGNCLFYYIINHIIDCLSLSFIVGLLFNVCHSLRERPKFFFRNPVCLLSSSIQTIINRGTLVPCPAPFKSCIEVIIQNTETRERTNFFITQANTGPHNESCTVWSASSSLSLIPNRRVPRFMSEITTVFLFHVT